MLQQIFQEKKRQKTKEIKCKVASNPKVEQFDNIITASSTADYQEPFDPTSQVGGDKVVGFRRSLPEYSKGFRKTDSILVFR